MIGVLDLWLGMGADHMGFESERYCSSTVMELDYLEVVTARGLAEFGAAPRVRSGMRLRRSHHGLFPFGLMVDIDFCSECAWWLCSVLVGLTELTMSTTMSMTMATRP